MKASSHLLHLSIFGYWRAAVVTLKERAQVTFSVFKSGPTLGVDYFLRLQWSPVNKKTNKFTGANLKVS